MQRSLYLFFFCLVCLLMFGSQANAFVCVNNSTDFQQALTNISNDVAIDNEVRLESGTYPILAIPTPTTGHFNVTSDDTLEISGGWDSGCATQTQYSPWLTELAGGRDLNGIPPDNTITQTEAGGVLSVTIKDNSSATVSIHNLTIKNGSSDKSGGGLYFLHTATSMTAAAVTVNLYDIIAEKNETNTFGSGIEILDNGTSGGMFVNISDCIIRDNLAMPTAIPGGPGGVSVEVPSSTGAQMAGTFISNCQILNNSAIHLGGGLYINSGTGDTILVNNVIAGNTVSDDNGGGVYIYNDAHNDVTGRNITLTNNTITGNESTGATPASQDGGGIYIGLFSNPLSPDFDLPAILDIYNNIIFNNTATGIGDDFFIEFATDSNNITINNNNFNDTLGTGYFIDGDQTNTITLFNNNEDPLFVNSTDFHLTASSPVINEGDNSAPAVPGDDLDGVIRPQNSTVDMEAYEFLATTTTTSTTSTTTTTTTLLPDPPIVTTGSATDISTSAATLEGQVNPNNGSTTYYFEYGLTTSYGSETDEIPDLTGNIAIDVFEDIEDLAINTTYHYRLVAYNAGGTSEGANRSFTTPEKNTPKAGGEGCFIDTAINGN
jgi:hypothetical protein